VNWTNEADNEVGTSLEFVPEKVGGLNIAATYTANFEPNTHSISYRYEGDAPSGVGLPAAQMNVPYGTEKTVADAPAVEGYTFSGWVSKQVTPGSDGKYTMPDENVVFVGSWTTNEYTIKYQYEGIVPAGVTSIPMAQFNIPYGTAKNVAAAPSLEGYTFSGWKTDDVTVNADGSYNMPANNVVFTGTWTEDDDITINYEASIGGAVDPDSEDLAPATGVASGSMASVNAGYHFVNWTNEAGETVGTDLEFIPAKVGGLNVAATYTANFEPNSYNLSYYLDNALIKQETILFGGEMAIDTLPVMTGYTVSGWFNPDGSNAAWQPGDMGTMPASDIDLYAVSAVNYYTVTYYYTNTVIPAGATPLPIPVSYAYGQTVTVAPDAAAAGYTFSGWNVPAGSIFEMPANDISVYGRFDARTVRITVRYVFGNGNPAAPTANRVAQYDEDYAIPSPILAGYTPDIDVIEGTVLSEEDLLFIVVYGGPGPDRFILEDLDVPLAGIGSRNVGDCAE
jgi:uncharacterized repeat protein (TIGR02543 family)